ncbi:MAG TPA: PilZ domain-containing protein [Spirochaetota bacterium]|nr:PilZ domain-containing protein [Spirochaetota bacterium]
MADKRQHQRVYPDSEHPVEIQIMGKGFLDIIFAKDISIKGIGIEVPHKFEGSDIDHPIELIITLPPNSCFKASGIIKHSNIEQTRKGIFGVQFTSIQKGYEQILESYITKRISDGGLA